MSATRLSPESNTVVRLANIALERGKRLPWTIADPFVAFIEATVNDFVITVILTLRPDNNGVLDVKVTRDGRHYLMAGGCIVKKNVECTTTWVREPGDWHQQIA